MFYLNSGILHFHKVELRVYRLTISYSTSTFKLNKDSRFYSSSSQYLHEAYRFIKGDGVSSLLIFGDELNWTISSDKWPSLHSWSSDKFGFLYDAALQSIFFILIIAPFQKAADASWNGTIYSCFPFLLRSTARHPFHPPPASCFIITGYPIFFSYFFWRLLHSFTNAFRTGSQAAPVLHGLF